MATITNLTGTTWYLAAGWKATAGLGQFLINGTMSTNSGSVVYDFTKLWVGYNATPVAYANHFYLYNGSSAIGNFNTEFNISFTFTGGTAATSEKLIAWLEANGELVSGGEEDELYLIDESTLTEIADAIRAKKGIAGYLDPANFASEILSIGQAPTTPTLISFTIDGTAYQAEEGMTWAEFVVSEYNVDNFYHNSTSDHPDGFIIDYDNVKGEYYQLRYADGSIVGFNDCIISNGIYKMVKHSPTHGGGAN